MDPPSILLLVLSVLLASLGLVGLAVARERWWDRRLGWAAKRLWSFTGGGRPSSSGELATWHRITEALGAAAGDPTDQGWVLELVEEAGSVGLRTQAALAIEDLGRAGAAPPPGAGADRRRRRLVGNLLILQRNPDPELLEVLLPCLLDPDPAVAGAAALAVGRHPACYPGAAIPLADALRQGSPRARQAQAWSLTALLEVDPSLIAVLAKDPAPEVRRLVVRSAGRCLERWAAGAGGGALAGSLTVEIERAVSDADAAVRRAALSAVRHLDPPRRRPILAAALADPAPAVRRSAAAALAAAGERSVALLAAALPAAEPGLRRQILAALEARTETAGRGVPEAVRTQAEEGSGEARRWAVEALGCLGGGPELRRLEAYLADPDAVLRAAACGALAAIARRGGAGSAFAAILPSVLERWPREDDPRALLALADVLAHSGSRSAKSAILTRLSSVAAPLRERLLEILARFERAAVAAEG